VLLKRLFDVVVSGVLLLLLLPLFLVIALVVLWDSPGPVFFRQTRIGRGGTTFGMLKFRSMVVNAERLGGFSTTRDDMRITRSGRFIRRTSLDELPQLINVLLGDMSLVGPRPDVPAQREGYTKQEWLTRHQVRPGITGLAQATVRSDAKPGERKALDLEYVARASLWLDIKILGMTIKQVLGRGSY